MEKTGDERKRAKIKDEDGISGMRRADVLKGRRARLENGDQK